MRNCRASCVWYMNNQSEARAAISTPLSYTINNSCFWKIVPNSNCIFQQRVHAESGALRVFRRPARVHTSQPNHTHTHTHIPYKLCACGMRMWAARNPAAITQTQSSRNIPAFSRNCQKHKLERRLVCVCVWVCLCVQHVRNEVCLYMCVCAWEDSAVGCGALSSYYNSVVTLDHELAKF